jgi:hypothetical protein
VSEENKDTQVTDTTQQAATAAPAAEAATSSNSINIVHATVAALRQLEEPRAVAARRGLDMDHVVPTRLLRAEAEHSKHEAEIAKAASK